MSDREPFKCDRCGLCCQNLSKTTLYDDLNDGTGVCRYYCVETHLCTIYENRPDKCNIKKYYVNLQDQYSYEEYLRMNYESCKRLKKEE